MVRDSYVQQTLQQVDEMEVRGLAPVTVTIYLRSIRRFIAHVGKPLGTVKRREVEEFLLDLARRGVHPRTRNVILGALRFAFRGLRRPESDGGGTDGQGAAEDAGDFERIRSEAAPGGDDLPEVPGDLPIGVRRWAAGERGGRAEDHGHRQRADA